MRSPARISLFVIVMAAILIAACGPAATPTAFSSDMAEAPMPTAAPAREEAPGLAAQDAFAAPADGDQKAGEGAPNSNAIIETGNTLPDVPVQSERKIIKNADVKLQVEDTDIAIDRSTQIVGDVGGYIISSRVWYADYFGKSYKYATISMGVPVDQFETVMRRLRGLAVKVLDENASGQDVTDQFVDLESQLGNLEATRDRIRTFLADAKTVDEALQVNQQLTEVEGQIEKVKGQMNYLSGRSAFSTITVSLEPLLPEITPSPTPTPTPTRTPAAWNPGKTVEDSSGAIIVAYQWIIEILIRLIIVVVPLLLPPFLVLWLLWKLLTRKGKKPAGE